MKNILKAACVLLVLGWTSSAQAQTGISGSVHDFSAAGWNSDGEICEVCHVPHNADATVADAPLWNHEVTASSYTEYSSPSLDATVVDPTGSSLLCLSCHDGTVALDNFGGATGGTNLVSTAMGTDLSGDHPVSFTYDSALATTDGGLADPGDPSGLGGTIADDLLIGGKLECASCHDVHRAYANASLLKISNDASGLCLTCHTK